MSVSAVKLFVQAAVGNILVCIALKRMAPCVSWSGASIVLDCSLGLVIY